LKVRRILITGGTGFVGSHLIHYLKSSGVDLSVVSSSVPARRESGVNYYTADIRDADETAAAIRAANPDQIFHLAGVSSVAASWNDPRRAFEVNVLGSCNVFEAAMRQPTPARILNVSTGQVYARSDVAIKETSRTSPDNPYAATKAMAELLMVQHQGSRSGGIVTVRAFNHTGPGQSPAYVLPSFAKQLAEMEAGLCPPVLKVGNIDVKRDFTDVRDVVVAYCELLENGKTGEVYNVCSGRAVLLADLLRELRKNCDAAVDIEIDPARLRADEPALMVGDPGKILRDTGWSPRIPLDNTIKDLLTYWRARIKAESAKGNDDGALTESLP
jgi:GDP-4-dehydro-6-deoxy-D-mannose reductase